MNQLCSVDGDDWSVACSNGAVGVGELGVPHTSPFIDFSVTSSQSENPEAAASDKSMAT